MKLFRRLLLLVCVCICTQEIKAQTQADLNDTACQAYKKADAELNGVYRQVQTEYRTDKVFLRKLQLAQRAWLVYRDAQLTALFPSEEPGAYGSVYPMCRCGELSELTNQRTEELKRWLTGTREGDVCAGSLKLKR